MGAVGAWHRTMEMRHVLTMQQYWMGPQRRWMPLWPMLRQLGLSS